MAMTPILGPDGKPYHMTPRKLITPNHVNALSSWGNNTRWAIQGEHSRSGEHSEIHYPKAAIWISDMRTSGSVHPSSMILNEEVDGKVDYHFIKIAATTEVVGQLYFHDGLPGNIFTLNSEFSMFSKPRPWSPYRRIWAISDHELEIRLNSQTYSCGVVIYGEP